MYVLELKSTISGMKNSLDNLNIILQIAENMISEIVNKM